MPGPSHCPLSLHTVFGLLGLKAVEGLAGSSAQKPSRNVACPVLRFHTGLCRPGTADTWG